MARLKIIVDDGNTYIPKPTEPKQPYSLAAHRILVNNWSFDKVTRFGLYDVQRLRSLYKTIEGTWTTEREKAHFYHWNGKPSGNLCADVRYETYWDVGGIEYNNYQVAFDALYEKLFMFIEPTISLLLAIEE